MTDRLRADAEQLLHDLSRTLYGDQQQFEELALIEAFARRQRAQALLDAQRAIVEACVPCEGQGWTIGVETADGHACDGTDESCSQNCPVPVPVQVQERCEYCGRPNDAIAALARAASEGTGK